MGQTNEFAASLLIARQAASRGQSTQGRFISRTKNRPAVALKTLVAEIAGMSESTTIYL